MEYKKYSHIVHRLFKLLHDERRYGSPDCVIKKLKRSAFGSKKSVKKFIKLNGVKL